jgi:hypothetical protein
MKEPERLYVMNPVISPDLPPRNTPWHRRIVKALPIPNTQRGNDVQLECGHWVQTFGKLELAEGRLLCRDCQGEVPCSEEEQYLFSR